MFLPILLGDSVIISFSIHPFDICSNYPELWKHIKILFVATYVYSNLLFSVLLYNRLFSKLKFKNIKHKKFDKSEFKNNDSELTLLIGKDENSNSIWIPESGLYQNFLITGTIGSGKTSSAMYPFTKQLLEHNCKKPNDKIGMLILDVKGNYYDQVKEYCDFYGLEDDLIVISLHSNFFYNPLHKPKLKPQVLANRLKTILTLFSENNSESYWLDKSEQILCEAIKICRLYNDNYVTFSELHKLITLPDYFSEKVEEIRNLFLASKLDSKQIYELNMSLDFFQKEFFSLDDRTKGILISEITRITNTFISDYDVFSTFSPSKDNLNFEGFEDVIKNGKIVVLNMNISEYTLLSRIIATYLKLDFQTEILSCLSKGIIRKTAFICDEYDKYCTKNDCEFFSLSREAKCINIVSTQSYSSLKNSLKDDTAVKVITQNLINKIWFRTDDMFTIEEVQKQFGKEETEKLSRTISEGAKETNYNLFTNSLTSLNSNISESYTSSLYKDFVYDTNFFTRELETFTALTFLSNGNIIYEPKKLNMLPYFKN